MKITNHDGDSFDHMDPSGLGVDLYQGGQGHDVNESLELLAIAWWLVRFGLMAIGAAWVCVWLYHAVRP